MWCEMCPAETLKPCCTLLLWWPWPQRSSLVNTQNNTGGSGWFLGTFLPGMGCPALAHCSGQGWVPIPWGTPKLCGCGRGGRGSAGEGLGSALWGLFWPKNSMILWLWFCSSLWSVWFKLLPLFWVGGRFCHGVEAPKWVQWVRKGLHFLLWTIYLLYKLSLISGAGMTGVAETRAFTICGGTETQARSVRCENFYPVIREYE